VLITAQNFPTPDLAWRTHDPAKLQQIRDFGRHQAAAAEEVLDRLVTNRFDSTQRHLRRQILVDAYDWACKWRYARAVDEPRPQGNDVGADPSRYLTTIADGGANYDRLGTFGRLRDGATWDPQTRTYVGGADTPASDILAYYGVLATERIRKFGDNDWYVNVISIPGASRLLTGNRLVTGESARMIAFDLVKRMAARGVDTSTVETGGELTYAVTANPEHAEVLRNIAFIQLVGAVELDSLTERIQAWQLARYLLFQGPLYKKGSDAVIRVFLVAVGAALFGAVPTMQQDADLRCMVLPQEDALGMPADMGLFPATATTQMRKF
jgi:hypothetical protein